MRAPHFIANGADVERLCDLVEELSQSVERLREENDDLKEEMKELWIAFREQGGAQED